MSLADPGAPPMPPMGPNSSVSEYVFAEVSAPQRVGAP